MGDVKPLLVVTGTRREGALVAGPGVTVLTGGSDGVRLAVDLARLAPFACGIISFGTCGGLIPGQSIGDMVIGKAVTGAQNYDCDSAWMIVLERALPLARIGVVFASGALLATARAKADAAAGGAMIVDMESHLAGDAAARSGLPFAILRCISDTAETALPSAIAVAMRPDGGLALGAVLASILRQPMQLPTLIQTGKAFGRAFAALKIQTTAVGPRLGFDRR